ncbi:hypothetical protein ACSSS7_000178 [Eimeria intestinalis]
MRGDPLGPHRKSNAYAERTASTSGQQQQQQQAASSSSSSSILRAESLLPLAAGQPTRVVNARSTAATAAAPPVRDVCAPSVNACSMRLLEEAHGFSVHPLLLEGPSGRTTDTTAATSLRVESSSSQRGCSCKGRVSSGHATHQGDKVALGCKRRFLLPLLSVLLLRLLLACRFWCFFEAVVPVAAADASPFHYRRKWKGPRLHLPPEGPNDVQLGGPHTGAGPSSSFWGPLSESSSDSAGYFFEAGLGGSRQSSRGPPLISQLRELAIQLQEGMRKASNALHQIKQFEGEGATAAATSSLSSMQADPTGPSGSEREGSPTMADALSALNSTLQRLLSEFTRGLSLLFTSEAQDQAGADTVDTPTSINGRGALKSSGLGALDAAGGGGGPPTALGQAQLSGGPSTQEVRRLAQYVSSLLVS